MADYWMRWVDFAKLRDLLALITESPVKFRPTALYRAAIASGTFVSSSGKPLGPSTYYHHHRFLEKLGLIGRRDGCFISSLRVDEYSHLFSHVMENDLSDDQRYVFGNRVVCNDDCYEMFFRAFMPSKRPCSVQEFIDNGGPIVLELTKAEYGPQFERRLILRNREDFNYSIPHQGTNAVQAIHFGMRAWGAHQLKFIDELYRIGEGYLLFPIEIRPQVEVETIKRTLVESLEFSGDWATPRVSELLFSVASRLKVSLKRVRCVLDEWLKVHSGFVSPITISDRMILSGQTEQMRPLILKGFLTLPSGEHVSHIQVHYELADRIKQTFGKEKSNVP